MKEDLMDFSKADTQGDFSLIPDKTLVKVRMNINPGYYDDAEKGWDAGWATKGQNGAGAIFLKAEYLVIKGGYEGRKIFGIIGLESPKGPMFKDMGRSFMRGVLESARGVGSKDGSDEANEKRKITDYGVFNKMEFLAEVSMGKDKNNEDRNIIKRAITLDHPRYEEFMGIRSVKTSNAIQDDKIPF